MPSIRRAASEKPSRPRIKSPRPRPTSCPRPRGSCASSRVLGPSGRDHRSLAHYPAAKARWVIDLLAERYRGVVTLEVFREADFEESLALVHTLLGAAQ